MTGLLALPAELLQEVLDAGPSDKKLRLVCKQFNFALEPRFFSTIFLWSRYLSSQVECLATTHPRPTPASKYATQLKISLYHCKEIVYESGVVSSEEEEDKIWSFLLPAITSLNRVRKVAWDVRELDPVWATRLVADGLASLPFLEDFHLRVWSSPDPPLQLPRLPNLNKLTFTSEAEDDPSEVILTFARLIRWSQPKLTNLIIANPDYDELIVPTLHDFLAETPSSLCLNITHLSLSSLHVKLDDATLRHLRSLISLTLQDISLPGSRDQAESVGLAAEEIWSTLRSEKIHLQEIVTDNVQPAFIEYLTSFSGLKRLELPQASFYLTTPLLSDQLALQFYERALQNHVNSLEFLEVRSGFEGKWPFGGHCSRIIKKCVCLASLKLSINAEDMPRREEEKVNGEAGNPSAGRENAVWSLLDLCVTLPVLKNLTLHGAATSRGDSFNTRWSHHERTDKRMAESLKSYGPVTSSHVFRVSIGMTEFGVRRDDFDTNLGYRSVAQLKH